MAKISKASRQPATVEPKLTTDDSADPKNPTDASAESQVAASPPAGQDADALLKEDHRKVEGLFKQFEDSDDTARKKELAREICKELIVHSRLEEEIFYPACREKNVETEALDRAQVEHDTVKFLIADILSRRPGSPFYDAKVKVLSELVKHHVAEEEKLLLGLFAGARKAGVDMAALGARLEKGKERLMAEADYDIEPPPMRALRAEAGGSHRDRREEKDMERWNERDERGGFMGSDDDDRRFSRGRYASSQDEDDSNGGRYPRRGGSGGRYSENDRERVGSQGGRYSENDRERGEGGRSQGGGRYGSGYGRPGGGSGGWSQSGGYEDDSRQGGAGGGGSGGYPGARSGGYSGRTGGFNDEDDYGRGGSRYGEGGGYATGYGGGFGSGPGGGMGGTQDYPRSPRRGENRGYGGGESQGFSGRDYGGGSGSPRSGQGDYGSSGDDDYSSRGGRSGRGGFSREREEYGRFRGEDDREWSGGRQGRRGSGPYRDD